MLASGGFTSCSRRSSRTSLTRVNLTSTFSATGPRAPSLIVRDSWGSGTFPKWKEPTIARFSFRLALVGSCTDPNAITEWLNDVLVNDPDYQDTTQKVLGRAADERHVFLLAGSATPWGVEELLRRLDRGLPSQAPSVPSEITHVWTVSSFTTPLGALWERDRGWTTIDAQR
jgi:hypothetical protein